MDNLKQLFFDFFLYNPQKPLIFTQFSFWVFFLLVMIGYSFFYRRNSWRNGYLLVVSLFFYYKCGGAYVWLLIFSIVSTYLIGIGISKSRRKGLRKFYVGLSVCISLFLLLYYKYTYFFVNIWNSLFHTHVIVKDYIALLTNTHLGSHFEISAIFLPIGISFFSFQALSYTIDLYRYKAKPVKSIIDFGFYKSFFPQLVAGPIVRAAEFIPQLYTKYSLSNREVGHALFLILNGLLKKMVISDFISINFVDRVFDNPLSYSGFENLLGVYGYALQIYCDFSGYTDIAIGLALLMGFRLPLNFNSPYKADNLTDFWRRWHISLSSWLRDYLYIPLGGNRRGIFRSNLNLKITMLLGGLWHGAYLRFLIWGGLHGTGLIVDKWFRKIFPGSARPWHRRFLSKILTFHFVCFAWIFFRASDMATVGNILSQIFNHFAWPLIPVIVQSYTGIIFLLVMGFTIHWLPNNFKEHYRGWFITSPVYVKVLVTVLVVVLVYQMKSSALQPFIYFQF